MSKKALEQDKIIDKRGQKVLALILKEEKYKRNTKFSKILGVTSTYVSELCNKKVPVSPRTIILLEDYFEKENSKKSQL